MAGGLQSRLHKWQYGFQKGFSVDSAIFNVLRTLELAQKFCTVPLYLLLLDWSKAYDRVHLPQAYEALYRLGLPRAWVDILQGVFKDPKFFVEDRLSKSPVMRQRTGFRQGDPLSCFLFIALLTVIFLDAEPIWRARAARENLTELDTLRKLVGRDFCKYADDANLLNTCLRSIRAMLHAIQVEAAYYGLMLNLLKTFLVRAGGAEQLRAPNLRDFYGSQVQVVNFEKTLGFDLGPMVFPKDVCWKRGSTMLHAMNQYKLIWTSPLSLKKKIEKYYAFVVSKGTWGLHLLTLRNLHYDHLEYIHVRNLRRILGIKSSYYSRISNAEVLRLANAGTIAQVIVKKQLNLFGHILRREPTHPDRLVLFQPTNALQPREPVDPRRPVGRPRLTWIDTILPGLERILQLTKPEIFDLAQNRRAWRDMVDRQSPFLHPSD